MMSMSSLDRQGYKTIALPHADNEPRADKSSQGVGLEIFVLRSLREHWFASIAILVSGIFLALILHACLNNKYEATASVLIDDRKQSEANAGSDSVFVNSQIELLTSESVLRSAIRRVGETKLYPESQYSGIVQITNGIKSEDRVYKLASRALKVRLEPRTSLIKVSFRHKDPGVAASFVNAVTESYLDAFRTLYTQAPAADFLRGEVDNLQRKVATAAAVLRAFETANHVYAIDEQRKLLLSRQSELATSLASVRTQLAQKREEIRVVEGQIEELRPKAARASRARDPSRPAPESVPLPFNRSLFGDDPPLLLVKLYQDTTQQFLALKMSIAGLQASEQAHAGELDGVAKDLETLAGLETETSRLKRQLTSAEQELAEVTTRAGEKRIAAAMTEKDLSAIKIAQPASIPFETASQSVWLFLAIGVFLSVWAAVGWTCFLQITSAHLLITSAYRSLPRPNLHFLRTIRLFLSLAYRFCVRIESGTSAFGLVLSRVRRSAQSGREQERKRQSWR